MFRDRVLLSNIEFPTRCPTSPNCYSITLSVESWMYWPLHVPNSNTDFFIFHHLTCVRLTRRRSESLFLATALANVSKSRESQGPASYFEQRSDTMIGNPRSVACTQNFERLPRKSFFGLQWMISALSSTCPKHAGAPASLNTSPKKEVAT